MLTTKSLAREKPTREKYLIADPIFNLNESGVIPDRDIHGATSAERIMPSSGSQDPCIQEFRNLPHVTGMAIIGASEAH